MVSGRQSSSRHFRIIEVCKAADEGLGLIVEGATSALRQASQEELLAAQTISVEFAT